MGGGRRRDRTAIVIEEVGGLRVVLADSGVNKLGTCRCCSRARTSSSGATAAGARREAMFSYALSEPEAASDAAAMKTRRPRRRANPERVKRWITTPASPATTGHGGDDRRGRGFSVRVEKTSGFSFGARN